ERQDGGAGLRRQGHRCAGAAHSRGGGRKRCAGGGKSAPGARPACRDRGRRACSARAFQGGGAGHRVRDAPAREVSCASKLSSLIRSLTSAAYSVCERRSKVPKLTNGSRQLTLGKDWLTESCIVKG